jgi:hypothetical protein
MKYVCQNNGEEVRERSKKTAASAQRVHSKKQFPCREQTHVDGDVGNCLFVNARGLHCAKYVYNTLCSLCCKAELKPLTPLQLDW